MSNSRTIENPGSTPEAPLLWLISDGRIGHENQICALAEAMAERGGPAHIPSDNGPEFIAREVQDWLREMGIATIYIDPDSPLQNGHVDRFHHRLRDECLNQEVFLSVTKARVVIAEGGASTTASTRTANLASKAPMTLPEP